MRLFGPCVFNYFFKKSRPVCLIRSVCLLIYGKFPLLCAYLGQASIRDPRVRVQSILLKRALSLKIRGCKWYFVNKNDLRINNLFDGIIDVTLFDGVEGLEFCVRYF